MTTTETDWSKMSEAEMRDAEAPHPKTEAELIAVVGALVERHHGYGTCVYAMSVAATAAFNYVAHRLGVTGFQAGCADMDILRRTRRMKNGFCIIDYENLLYPQYEYKFTMSAESLLAEPAMRKRIRAEAKKNLDESGDYAHLDVLAHWRRLADLPVLEGEEE